MWSLQFLLWRHVHVEHIFGGLFGFRMWNGKAQSCLSPFLFDLFITFFFLQKKLRNADSEALLFGQGTLVNISLVFVQCLLGKMATERFAQMPNHLFHSKWYRLPVKTQKYFILMLANTQQPVFFDGFEMFVLNLETFSSVSVKWPNE